MPLSYYIHDTTGNSYVRNVNLNNITIIIAILLQPIMLKYDRWALTNIKLQVL